MKGLLVAPSEPDEIKALGKSAWLPEDYGVDVFGVVGGKKVGVQRKEVRDFVASVQDGRLGKEIVQMGELDVKMVLVEGKLRWDRDGELVDQWARMSKSQMRGALWSVRSVGAWVEWSEGKKETVEVVRHFFKWLEKDTHWSLVVNSGVATDGWGKKDNKAWQVHLLSTFPGVGAKTAEKIVEEFGGVPLKWEVGEEDLVKIDGVGKVTARKVIEALE